jgi:site-specific recombinase XerD
MKTLKGLTFYYVELNLRSIMFALFSRRFLEDRALTCSKQTIKLYHHYLKQVDRWLKDTPITKQSMGDFLRSLKDRSLADETIRNYYRFLKAFCNFLFAEGLIDKNPFQGKDRIRIASARRKRMKTYSDNDIAKLLAVSKLEAANKRNKNNKRRRWSDDGPLQRELAQAQALILLLCDSALRAGEVTRLNCGHVRQSELVVLSKGGHNDVAYITETTRLALIQLAGDRPENEPLFRNWEGDRCTTAALRNIIERTAIRAHISLPPRPLHAFRHYAARQWTKKGVNDLVIKDLMRHSQLSTTQIYTGLDTDELNMIHAQASPVQHLLRLAQEK